MSTDASRKLIGLRICQEFCRMFPTGHGKVNPVEMSPFLMTMRLIKQFYGFSKPEVYSTLIALLQDYDPSLGVKHRERTMRYIRLLLVDQPDLADYLLYLLPESVRSYDNEGLQQQQQPSKCIHCSAQTVRCEKRTTAESLHEEPIHGNSLLQRMLVLPASESFQDFTTAAVRIAPAINSAAGITTTTANSALTFGKSSKIALPHLVKNATTGQVKQLQMQTKPTMLSTLLYSPNIVIKSELLTDAPSIVTLPRISSTVAATSIPINAVQDASNPLARNLGLKLATHINALPKYGTNKAALASSKAPLLRTAPLTVFESSCSRDNRTSDVSLDDRLENIIKKFGKEAQMSSVGRVTSVHQQMTEKSFVPSSFFYPKLSCVRNNDTKETIVVQKQPEFNGRSTHASVANGLVRCMPTFSQSQPMFLIEKTRRNIVTSSFDSAGIRIIKKSKVSTSGLPLTRFDKLPATVTAESSPLISLKKLVAGVGLLKSFENETISHSPTVISNRDAALDSVMYEKAPACDKSQEESVDDAENDGTKESDHQGVTSGLKSLLDHENVEVEEKHPENETKPSGDSFRPVLENSFDKEVCNPSDSVESEERLSLYSDETSRSLLLNDGTSDYHISDEEQAPPTGSSTRPELNGSKCSPSGDSSQRNATSALGLDEQLSNEEPLCKKLRVATPTDNSSQYEGCTYLARLMELPSPPNYGHDYPWDLVTDDKKRKGKTAIKRKRKK